MLNFFYSYKIYSPKQEKHDFRHYRHDNYNHNKKK